MSSDSAYLKRTLLAAFVAAGIVVCSAVAQGDPQWTPFTSKEGRFSILMIGTPHSSQSETSSPVGVVKEHLYSAECGAIMLDAEYANLPALAALFGGRSRIYRDVVGEFMQREQGTELGFATFVKDAYRGRVLTYEAKGRFGKLWMLLISRRLYVLNASVPRDYPDKSVIDVYLDSFQPIYQGAEESHAGKG
jgi:hypothetical protein